jgi:hypothetical protein
MIGRRERLAQIEKQIKELSGSWNRMTVVGVNPRLEDGFPD